MRKRLTETQQRVFNALRKEQYWSPNISQISRDFNIPISTVHAVVKMIRDKKFTMKAVLEPRLIVELPGEKMLFMEDKK